MSQSTSLFGAIKSTIVATAGTVTTSANAVNNMARVGEVMSQNLLATTYLDGMAELLEKHGEDVADKLANATAFYNSLHTGATSTSVPTKPTGGAK